MMKVSGLINDTANFKTWNMLEDKNTTNADYFLLMTVSIRFHKNGITVAKDTC